MGRKRILLLMLTILSMIQIVQAGDWPMFRNDVEHSGITDELIKSPLELSWYYNIGNWPSSPSISNGIVYVSSLDNYVYALDVDTGGSLKWKYKTDGWGVQTSISTPAISGNILFVGGIGGDKNVYALDANTGVLKWKYLTGDVIGSSPTVSGGVVYIGSGDSNLYAFDANNGSLLWKYKTGSAVLSSPAVSGGVVYVGSYDTYIYALDASTGTLVWRYRTGGVVISSPAVSGGVVYVGSDDTYIYALDANTGVLKWKYKTGAKVAASSAISGGVVYIGSSDGYLYALDANTGSLKWSSIGVFSSPTVSNGVIYANCIDGYFYALDANSGNILWKYPTQGYGGNFISSPAVSNGKIYVGSNGRNLYAFSPSPTTPTPTPTPIPDTILPTILISSPSNGQTFSTNTITLSGTASDNIGLRKVEVKVGIGIWQLASGTTSWSKQVTLSSDSNTIYARATDTSGNNGVTSVTIEYISASPTSPVSTPDASIPTVSSTPQYTITATPVSDYVQETATIPPSEKSISTSSGQPSKSSTSVSLHGEKTDVVLGEDILLRLSAVNLITKPKMNVQVIIIPPSGMSVTSSEFSKVAAGQFSTHYELEPGDGKDIEVKIKSNQIGDFNVNGRIVYYFGDDKEKGEDYILKLPIKVRSVQDSAKNAGANPSQNSIPGFEVLSGIFGLLLVVLKRGFKIS